MTLANSLSCLPSYGMSPIRPNSSRASLTLPMKGRAGRKKEHDRTKQSGLVSCSPLPRQAFARASFSLMRALTTFFTSAAGMGSPIGNWTVAMACLYGANSFLYSAISRLLMT